MPTMPQSATTVINTVTAEQRYLFDLQGFIVLQGVLTQNQCANLIDSLVALEEATFDDHAWRRRLAPEHQDGASPTRDENSTSIRMNGLLRLTTAFDHLIDHPIVSDYLHGFMGTPQLVNTWSISKRRGTGAGGWHRGVGPMHYSCRDGTIRTAMLNVVWFLTDNGPDDGCMCAVPGSHKSDLAHMADRQGAIPVLVGGADFAYHTYPGLTLPGSVPITGNAGDVLVFSEALIHSGLGKTSDGIRRNLYFNHLQQHHSVAGYEPCNMRHFWLPDRVRERFSPARRAMTAWMSNARYELDE